jgi:hypothetical protein
MSLLPVYIRPVYPLPESTVNRFNRLRKWSEMGYNMCFSVLGGFGFFGPNPTEPDPWSPLLSWLIYFVHFASFIIDQPFLLKQNATTYNEPIQNIRYHSLPLSLQVDMIHPSYADIVNLRRESNTIFFINRATYIFKEVFNNFLNYFSYKIAIY